MRISMFEYENVRRVSYDGGAVFVPVCVRCGRFVKPDDKILTTYDGLGIDKRPNATCSKCGRTRMLFEGFVGD